MLFEKENLLAEISTAAKTLAEKMLAAQWGKKKPTKF